MKNKPGDIPYCGVRKDFIEKAKPKLDIEVLEHLAHFIKERYKIHILKDIEHQPAPWTNDTILKSYRFTNVRREHDKETKWLIKHITSNDDLSVSDKLLNCVLFRLYNKHETCEIINMPIEFDKFSLQNYRGKFRNKTRLFTGAFFTTGMRQGIRRELESRGIKATMSPYDPIKFVGMLHYTGFVEAIGNCTTLEAVCGVLKNYKGIGGFLAYQIAVDFTYIDEFPFSENEFTIAGPGCKQGLDRLFVDRDGMTYEECLFWIRDNWTELINKHRIQWNPDEIFTDLPDYDRCMNVMSLENCFCELSKYERAVNGSGRPRIRYNGNGG